MEGLLLLRVLVVACLLHSIFTESLDEVLSNYDRLHHLHIKHHIVKRSTDFSPGHIRDVTFDTLGRHFHARLQSKQSLLASDFAAYVIDANNQKREIYVDQDDIYEGFLVNEPESEVHAHWEGEAMLAKIKTKSEVYYIEPAWRFLNESDENEMITYRASDMKSDVKKNVKSHIGKKFCGYVDVPENLTAKSKAKHRNKREVEVLKIAKNTKEVKDTCSLLLVADYRFFKNMGQNSTSRTSNYLIGLIDRVDAIYRSTEFGGKYQKMGFEVKEIRIHDEASTPIPGKEHYNERKDFPDRWDTKALLEAFSSNDYSEFCLAHLFTALADEQTGMLGLSYVAKASLYKPGGVCSHQVYYKGEKALYLNTGWSSSLNSYNRRILTQEADLVTTHEFGHNWGSEHDPDTDSCSPNAEAGGKFIMYTYSVPGYDPNNKLFSPCSRAAMREVLEAKSRNCFIERRGAYCGNQKVEGKEECDGGITMRDGRDKCCEKNCKLRVTAVCSDRNHICCQDCQFLGTDVVCHHGDSFDASCEATTNCTGHNGTCPMPDAKRDGTECLGMGKCFGGVCQPFCESMNKTSCICDDVQYACQWCCRDNNSSKCVPYKNVTTGEYLALPDGTPCYSGSCNKSKCIRQEGNLVQRIWSIIDNISPDKVLAFMRANIVGSVIILSLFLWVPGSIVIWCLDQQRQEEEEEHTDWLSYDNASLTLPSPRERPQLRRFPSYEPSRSRTSRVCLSPSIRESKAIPLS